MFRRLTLCCFGWLLLAACRPSTPHLVSPGIYYWKTSYQPTEYERKKWDSCGIQRLYLHCFDVALDRGQQKPIPLGILRNIKQEKQPIIPVIFITQEVVRNLKPTTALELATNINKLLEEQCQGLNLAAEVQMDCDWTESSRGAYFGLLRLLRQQSFFRHKILSVTIRMHQLKYRLRSGIPPADRGLLMCYNMGDLKNPNTTNSIIDPQVAESYLKDLKSYPLKMDIALPIYSWVIQFRKGLFMGILRGLRPEDVSLVPSVVESKKSGRFLVLKDTILKGYELRRGDMLRIEESSLKSVQQVAGFTAKNLAQDSLSVVLFHSDSLTLSNYSAHALQSLFDHYR